MLITIAGATGIQGAYNSVSIFPTHGNADVMARASRRGRLSARAEALNSPGETMNRTRFAVFIAGAALAVLTVGCDETRTTNTNNGNTAVLTNANSNVVVATNANTNVAAAGTRNANISREEFDRDKARYEREAKERGRKVGSGPEDLWLWTKTRAALAATDDLRDSTIDVDVENNVATLTGTVATAAQKTRAEQVAKGIEGVKTVTNRLTVSATGNTNGNTNTRNANTRS
jgi:hyperosmotically inducible protein